jgi:hypothetical protein
MALVNGVISNLYNGVSQQPDPLRHPSQCTQQDNAYPTIATGLRKRPAFHHIAKIKNSIAADAFTHLINRDESERYIVVILDGDLEVYSLAGVQQTVTFPNGKGYLSAATPRTSFSVVTVADYTFIVNKTVTALMDTTTSGAASLGSKQKFSELPTTGNVTGHIWKIEGDDTQRFDDYYVRYDATGVWVETIAPSQETIIDKTTMPYTLVRNSNGTFTFSYQVWNDRLVGSSISNKSPSFIGQKIQGIFFHRNRLGFHAGESIVMSRAGLYFNFWSKTTTAVLDDDPVDIQVSHTKVSILRHVIPFDKTLLLFSDQTQFQLTATESLTPKTVSTEVVTEFESTKECSPVGLGNSVYFASDKGTASSIREYFVDETTITNDAADVTAHAPSYIPPNLYQLEASSTEDLVVALSTSVRNTIYIYKVYWNGQEKAQSSWGRYLFNETDTVLHVGFINSTLYAVIQRADGIYLEKTNLQEGFKDTGFTHQILLDRQVTLTGAYNSVTNVTTWTLPYADAGDFSVIRGSGWSSAAGGIVSSTHSISSSTIEAVGNFSTYPCIIGRKYDLRYRFSEQSVRDTKGIAIQSANFVIKNMSVAYSNSGFFKIEVTPRARGTYTYKFTGGILGDLSATIGKVSISSGSFKFPVRTKSLGATIDIVSDSHLPCILQSAEWVGEFVKHSTRV